MSSQFSLSLELTKLVPFGSLVNATGHGLVRLLREIQASGSDFITEQDLAEVFGRNRLEPLFASTFRTAVKRSLVHHITGIAELIFEGGAGPTVRRSLNEDGYFAMIVQLSLLTYAHELSSLAAALTKAFERRNQGSQEYVAPPRYDALKGALRAIREQTCGFMWELIISAVEKRLYPNTAWTDGSLYTIRAIPQVLLQGLLDSFTAIQHLPEHTRLQINSSKGAPTIIVWAHHILGLSVKISVNDEVVVFGDGPVTVYIDADWRRPPVITLLNESDEEFFHLSEQQGDQRLAPVARHPVRDYGTRVLRLRIDDRDTERHLVEAIVTSCIAAAREGDNGRKPGARQPGALDSISVRRVLSVSKLLFVSSEHAINAINLNSELPCIARRLDPENDQHDGTPSQLRGHGKVMLRLTHVIFVLCMTQGLDEDLPLHIDALDDSQYMPFHLPEARQAFGSLASLLEGRVLQNDKSDVSASVVSAWGWSLCVGSLSCQDPSDAQADMSFIRGVPTRGGEKRRYIIDGAWSMQKEILGLYVNEQTNFTVASAPGEQCQLRSMTPPKPKKYFIGVTDDAFEVVNIFPYELPPRTAGGPMRPDAVKEGSISCGFRSMQEAAWSAHHIPTCEHLAAAGQSVVLPPNVWAFHGFSSPGLEYFPADAVLAGLTAEDPTARWILMAMILYGWRAKLKLAWVVCLRGRDCCFECAIQFAQSCRGGNAVGLVL
ncbi:MAG: hypothetical protein LQ346_001283 [Caloplaca aetnensis]|nr:MAG: hypothetical protein LQ346_001283 [Caloplaca aetnensis]